MICHFCDGRKVEDTATIFPRGWDENKNPILN